MRYVWKNLGFCFAVLMMVVLLGGIDGWCSVPFSSKIVAVSPANNIFDSFAIDLDQDGDTDIIAGIEGVNKLSWFENDGSQSFSENVLSSTADYPYAVLAVDIDDDNDIDIITVEGDDSEIILYKNDGSENFSSQFISTSIHRTSDLDTIDIDDDGDIDILCSSEADEKIRWLENDGSENFSEHTISTSLVNPMTVYAADFDGDGDPDVVSASYYHVYTDVEWYENDGAGNFTTRVIAHEEALFNEIYSVAATYPADVDGDGDMDVLAITSIKILWFENDGSPEDGEWDRHFIVTSIPGAGGRDIHPADFDGDGDLDFVACAQGSPSIAWFENDGSGNFTTHSLKTTEYWVQWVQPADIDSDGDIDITGNDPYQFAIYWYENMSPPSVKFATTSTSISENVGSVTKAVVLTHSATQVVDVTFSVTDISATLNIDYDVEPASGLLQFASGEISKDVIINVTNDVADEDDELFLITITGASAATIASASVMSVTVADDDTETPDAGLYITPDDGNLSGNTKEYAVNITNASGVLAYRVALDIDSATVSYVDGSASKTGTVTASGWSDIVVNDTNPDKIYFGAASASSSLGAVSGELFTFRLDFSSALAGYGDYITVDIDFDNSLTNLNDEGITVGTTDFDDQLTPENDLPTFTLGADREVLNVSAQPRTVSNFATNIFAGSIDEVTSGLYFSTETDQPQLFSATPVISATNGDLNYTPAPDEHGIASVTAVLHNSIGPESSAPQAFTITMFIPFDWGDMDDNGSAGGVDANYILKFNSMLISGTDFPGYPASEYPEYMLDATTFPPAADVNGDATAGTLDASLILQQYLLLIDYFPADTSEDGEGPDPFFYTGKATRQMMTGRTLRADLKPQSGSGDTWQVVFSIDDSADVAGVRLGLVYDKDQLSIIDSETTLLASDGLLVTNNQVAGRYIVSGALTNPLTGGAQEILQVTVRTHPASGETVARIDPTITELNDGQMQIADGTDTTIRFPLNTHILEWSVY